MRLALEALREEARWWMNVSSDSFDDSRKRAMHDMQCTGGGGGWGGGWVGNVVREVWVHPRSNMPGSAAGRARTHPSDIQPSSSNLDLSASAIAARLRVVYRNRICRGMSSANVTAACGPRDTARGSAFVLECKCGRRRLPIVRGATNSKINKATLEE